MIRRDLIKKMKRTAVKAIAVTVMIPMIMGLASIKASAQDSSHVVAMDGNGEWKYFSNGSVDNGFTGLASNDFGWWYINAGSVDWNYTGAVQNEFGWWAVRNGGVDFSYNGVAQNEFGWWKISNGGVDFNYNGVAQNEFGWWKISNGAVDFNYNGVAQNEFGWWKITNGGVDFNYNGLASNENGIWVIKNGAVDFSYNGTYQFNNGTYNVTDGHAVGKGELRYSDQYNNWCYFVGDIIDWSYTGVGTNSTGIYYVTKGVVDWYFYGVAYDKDLGYLLFSKDHYDNGKNWFNKNYIGKIIYNGITYDVNEGHATVAAVNLNSTYRNRPIILGDFLVKGEYNGDKGYHFFEAEDGMVYYFATGRYYCEDNDDSGKFVFCW